MMIMFMTSAISQTLIYSRNVSSTPNYGAYSFDVEEMEEGNYNNSYKYKSIIQNNTIIIYNFLTGINEAILSLPQIDLSEKIKVCHVYLYKNFYQNDGQWSIVLFWYNSNDDQTLAIYTNGIEKFRKESTGMPGFFRAGSSLYMTTTSTIDSTLFFYSIRDDIVSQKIEPYQKANEAKIIKHGDAYIAMIPTVSEDKVKWQLFKVDGGLVKESEEKSNSELTLVKIDLKNNEKGAYLFKVNTGSNVFVNTIVK